jgi:hypothetical protein
MCYGLDIKLSSVLCVEDLVPNAVMFRGVVLGSNWIMRALTSSMD